MILLIKLWFNSDSRSDFQCTLIWARKLHRGLKNNLICRLNILKLAFKNKLFTNSTQNDANNALDIQKKIIYFMYEKKFNLC